MNLKEKQDYESIYKKHVNELYSYGLALGIEKTLLKDIIHDVFLHLFEHSADLENIRNTRFYLFRSLKNKYINRMERDSFANCVELNESYQFPLEVTALDILEEKEEREQTSRLIEKMLNTLTAHQREAIYLRYIQGMEYQQIATLLNVTPKGARKLIYRSIDHIRKIFGVEMVLLFLLFFEKTIQRVIV